MWRRRDLLNLERKTHVAHRNCPVTGEWCLHFKRHHAWSLRRTDRRRLPASRSASHRRLRVHLLSCGGVNRMHVSSLLPMPCMSSRANCVVPPAAGSGRCHASENMVVNKVKLQSLKPAPGVCLWYCESLSSFLTCLTNRVVGSQAGGLFAMRLQMSIVRSSMDVRTRVFLARCSM